MVIWLAMVEEEEGWGGGGGGSVHQLYNLPAVPDGTAQHHADDHSYDLKSDRVRAFNIPINSAFQFRFRSFSP